MKKIAPAALLSYHPDRFDRLVHRVKDIDNAQQKLKDWGLRVSQVLNELNHAIGQNSTLSFNHQRR